MSSPANPTAPTSPATASRAPATRRNAQVRTSPLQAPGGLMLRNAERPRVASAGFADAGDGPGRPRACSPAAPTPPVTQPNLPAAQDAMPPISPASTRPEASWPGRTDAIEWTSSRTHGRAHPTDAQDVDQDATPKLGSGGPATRESGRTTPPQTPPGSLNRTLDDPTTPRASRRAMGQRSHASSSSSSSTGSSSVEFSGPRMASASPPASPLDADGGQTSAASCAPTGFDSHALVRLASSDEESVQTDALPPFAARQSAPAGHASVHAHAASTAPQLTTTPQPITPAPTREASPDVRGRFGPPLVPMPLKPTPRWTTSRPDKQAGHKNAGRQTTKVHAATQTVPTQTDAMPNSPRTSPAAGTFAATPDGADAPLSLSRRASSATGDGTPGSRPALSRSPSTDASFSASGQQTLDEGGTATVEGKASQGTAGHEHAAATTVPETTPLRGAQLRGALRILADRFDTRLNKVRHDGQAIQFIRSPASTRGFGPTQVRLAPNWRAPLCFPSASHAELLDATLGGDVGTALLKFGFWRGARATNAALSWWARQEMAVVLGVLDALNEPREPGLFRPVGNCVAVVGSLVGCALLTVMGCLQLVQVAVGVGLGGAVGLVHQAILLLLLPRDVLDGLQDDLPHVLLRTSSEMYARRLEEYTYAQLTEVARVGLGQDQATGNFLVAETMQKDPKVAQILGQLQRYRGLMVAAQEDADQMRRYLLAGHRSRMEALNLGANAMLLPLAGGVRSADDLWHDRSFRKLPELCRRAQHDPQRVAAAESDALERYRTQMFRLHPELCAALGLPNPAALDEQPSVRERTAVLSGLDPLQLLHATCNNMRNENDTAENLQEALPTALRQYVADVVNAARPAT